MKKIFTLTLVIVLVAALSIGGTIAFLTATDKADNKFTVGNVDVELLEHQRKVVDGKHTTELEQYQDGKLLMPAFDSVQKDTPAYGDALGLVDHDLYVDKIVNAQNTGSQPEYVRIFIAFPSELAKDYGKGPSVHFAYNMFFKGLDDDGVKDPFYWSYGDTQKNVVIDGVAYDIDCATYTQVLNPGEKTKSAAMAGIWMDKDVDLNAEGKFVNNGHVINYDFSNGVVIPVFVQAVQSAGFESAEAAFAASGLPMNPWAPATK